MNHSSQHAQDESTDDATTPVGELRNIVREFVDQRDWRQFHNAKNLSMALSIEAGELMEHFQWLTTQEVVDRSGYSAAEVAEELADVVSYALALANILDIDLSTALRDKMVKNRLKYPVA
ncbi:nucleotide pyrophosphohydrolase [Aureliella helgolandensis]|uniref:MazG nucleotide pyrophosphohydrolase domain protein n=1 Tax=Aureliella helgolandensis TaxID=2527968 RepID=A0A518GDA0_9BACT|nr:nucleotide pyrophosphohydrolase [Aureliella helgolandensis]QDV26575.1 MazG nucleotide pyrophosphohydrolase domain protein [Aureliella helgolandensis]